MLHINFVNDLTFKTIHDLLADCGAKSLTLQEELDGAVDLDYLFTLAHYLKEINPNLHITYKTERSVYPLEDLSAEMAFRDVPFDIIILKTNDERI